MRLRTDDQVLFWDGSTLLEFTKVVLVDKEKSQVKLSNGVYLDREALKKGYFKRADKSNRSKARAWKYEEGGPMENLWKAYLFKRKYHTYINGIEVTVDSINLESLVDDTNLQTKLLKIEKLIKEIHKL